MKTWATHLDRIEIRLILKHRVLHAPDIHKYLGVFLLVFHYSSSANCDVSHFHSWLENEQTSPAGSKNLPLKWSPVRMEGCRLPALVYRQTYAEGPLY